MPTPRGAGYHNIPAARVQKRDVEAMDGRRSCRL